MKRILFLIPGCLLFASVVMAQGVDFVPGYNVIFEDNFERDPIGDFPAKWNSSGDGEVVQMDGVPGKWLKISQPTAVSPDLMKSLPENCTIEFDLYLANTTGVAPHIMFGLTTLSTMSAGNVYRSHISAKLEGYNESGSVSYGKNIQSLGEKNFPLNGYVDRILHVSISVNKTRWRVYLDDQKVVDLPKLLTPEFRKNFFIASSVVIPSPEAGVFISNMRIAAGDADARSLLIKQLMEEGSAITSDIQFSSTNEFTPQSLPLIDQLGQTLQQNPDMNIEINSMEEVTAPEGFVQDDANPEATDALINKASLKKKADKIKSYLVSKFRLKTERILTGAKAKIAEAGEKNKTVGKAKKLLTEFIKL
jgi:hypothetical protein